MSPNVRNPTLNENEKHYVSKAGWYSLRYPSYWIVEEGQECTTFFDPENGVGALQVSAYETPTKQNPKDVLMEYLSDHSIPFDEKKLICREADGRSIASYNYAAEPWFKRVWFISEDNHLLMITHNRKGKYQETEDREVERIVDSVIIEPANSTRRTVN